MKYLGLFLFILLFSISCSTRKKVLEKEKVVKIYDTLYKRDSVFIAKDKIIMLPSVNTEVISKPCDSLGNLKVIEKIIRIPYGQVKISSDGNNLITKVNTDSISSVVEKQHETRNEKQLKKISELEKENKTLKVTPFNWWKVGCIISLMVNVVFVFLLLKNKFIR
jgi:hypothetical protein